MKPSMTTSSEGAIDIQAASLEVRGLSKAFSGTRVVSDVSFRIEGGTFLTILGPSGSGKTTTLRMIAGFDEPSAGEVLVGDEVISDRPAHKRNIGVVFQQYALFPHMTVFQNVAYPLEMRKCPRAEISRRVLSALGLVRLQGFEGRYPRQLSGGQQQRVGLARAIVFQPPVILMDEPLGALDKRLREMMQVEIRQLQKRLGITTISVTHDQVEAIMMSDIIAILDRGVLQQIGPPLEVYRHPANEFVADFIGESNLLYGMVTKTGPMGTEFRTGKGLAVIASTVKQARPDVAGHMLVRPEYVRLGVTEFDARNRYQAEVLEILFVGDLVKYRLLLESGDELLAKTLVSLVRSNWVVGQKVVAGWDPDDCLVIHASGREDDRC